MSGHKLIIGKFRYDQYGVLRGHIGGLGLGAIEVMSQDAISAQGVSYMRLIADPMGASYEVGSAFSQMGKNGKFFTVGLDSPFLPAPIRAAMFKDRNDAGLFNMVWNRKEPDAPPPTE